MRIFDIGANLGDAVFTKGIFKSSGVMKHPPDLLQVLKNSETHNISDIMITTTSPEDLPINLHIINDYQDKTNIRLKTTVGIHPTQANLNDEQLAAAFNQLFNIYQANKKHIEAIGECGLDYDRLHFANKESQLKVFHYHLRSSDRFDHLPFFFHLRNAYSDFYQMIKNNRHLFQKGVVHSFDGTIEEALELIKLGLYIGLNGCSFKNSIELAKELPLDWLMVESDAPWCTIRNSSPAWPFLQSENYQYGVKGRNEPFAAQQVLRVIAETRSLPIEQVASIIYENSCQLFNKN